MEPPDTYDPERWARRWAFVVGAALVSASFVPVWTREYSWTDMLDLAHWDNDWTRPGRVDPWEVWAPTLAGLVALATAAKVPRAVRAWLLLLAGLLPVARAAIQGAGHFLGREGYTFWFVGRGILVLVVAVGATTAAGNHLRRRYPRSTLARRIAGVGGLLLALGFGLVSAVTGISALFSLASVRWSSGTLLGLAILAGFVYVFVYGLKSASQGAGGVDGEGRSITLARMARVFLVVASVVAAIPEALGARAPGGLGTLAVIATRAARTLFHEGGQAALMALGIAVAFEPRVRRSSGLVAPEELERVFG